MPVQSSTEVANTILAQLGGNKFVAMTGAKHFTGGTNSLSFLLPLNATDGRISHVKITLNARDLYDMEFYKFDRKKLELVPIASHCDIYFDQLQGVFTDETNLVTSL